MSVTTYRDQLLGLLEETGVVGPYDTLESYALIVHGIRLPRGRLNQLLSREAARYRRDPKAEPVWLLPSPQRTPGDMNWRALARSDWPLAARLSSAYPTGVLRLARLAADRAPAELWPLQARGAAYEPRAIALGRLLKAHVSTPPADPTDRDSWLAANAAALSVLEPLEGEELAELETTLTGQPEASLFFGAPTA